MLSQQWRVTSHFVLHTRQARPHARIVGLAGHGMGHGAEELPLVQMGTLVQVAGILGHAEHQAALAGCLVQRFAVPLGQPLQQQVVDLLAKLDAAGARGEPLVLQLGHADQLGHRRPRLRALHRGDHVAVAGGHQLLESGTAHWPAALDGAHVVVVGQRLDEMGGEALDRGDVDGLALAREHALEQGGRRGHRGVDARHVE